MGKHKRKKTILESKVSLQQYTEPMDDLFDNPMTRAALSAMSKEDIEKYKKIGEELYGKVDFTKSKNLDNTPEPILESLSYIETQIQSGMHPSMLEDDEKELIKSIRGNKWYEEWGYVELDLDDIVTTTPHLKRNLD